MSESITVFFGAWCLTDSAARLTQIASAVVDGVEYSDPRTATTISGIDALSDYVGMFSANAPGWSATVIKSDSKAGVTRATVAFAGPGPDGSEQVQLGQYFIEKDGAQIARMVGFVGIGD